MLIGLFTLISIFLFGGGNEYFLVDKLEKGVKEYVVDKERKKEITADLKDAAKHIKAYDKKRNNRFKDFLQLNSNRETTEKELDTFFDQLMQERKEFQEYIINRRVEIVNKIKPDEWVLILEKSAETVKKRNEKLQKEIDKGKMDEPFTKTKAYISDEITDKGKSKNLLTGLNEFIEYQNKAAEKIKSTNVSDSDLISKRDATVLELGELATKVNKLRSEGYQELINFHLFAKENTTDDEWNKLMKLFNKELNITGR